MLTVQKILHAHSDGALFKLLSVELESRLPSKYQNDLRMFLPILVTLPPGLRAMAAIYELDVSMNFDDLGWHFANWHDEQFNDEILQGLRELDALEPAEIFQEALRLVRPFWSQLQFPEFAKWYECSDLAKLLEPLNHKMWSVRERSPEFGLLVYWLHYARAHPERTLGI